MGLLRRDPSVSLMISALHFLNFRVSPGTLSRWRLRTVRQHLAASGDGTGSPEWGGELFVDSGGFLLITSPGIDLSRYGIPRDRMGEEILRLQLDMGADRIASLDWPIPPGLSLEEVRIRLRKTMVEAIRAGRMLAELSPEHRPAWMVPVHGPTPEAAAGFAREMLDRLRAEGLLGLVSGMALGSMVPLRMGGLEREVLEFVRAVRRVIPEELPLHVFGMTGSMIPFLLNAGATSFDSSTYVQRARNRRWLDPVSRRWVDLRQLGEVDRYPCDCPVCEGRSPRLDVRVLEGLEKGRRSSVYAAIALHNIELDFRLFREAVTAWREGHLEAMLGELPHRFPGIRPPDPQAALFRIPRSLHPPICSRHPDGFDLRRRTWEPRPGKRILLILPCSRRKPYYESISFRRVWRRVVDALRERAGAVQVVFLSGLYGPVPMELAGDEAVVSYDFLLHRMDLEGISRVAERLADFLRRTEGRFLARMAYLPLPAYREAARRAAAGFPDVRIFSRRTDLDLMIREISSLLRSGSPEL